MLSLLLVLLLGAPSPLRLTDKVFGKPAEIEVRDLPQEVAQGLIRRAFAEIAELERLTDAARPDGGLAVLNAAAGKGPQTPDPRLLTLLGRARDFCFWSEGTHGPLGRDLYLLWGLRTPVAEAPPPERLAAAAGLTACTRLALDPQKGTAALDAGSGLDLWGFAEGFAVDRAVEILRQGGAGNGLVRIGAVQRGFGAGPAGKGWRVELPSLPGLEGPAGQLYLRDRALAFASPADHPAGSAGASSPAYVSQRTGRPTEGVLATVTVTELAMDAQGLATSLFILGPREGQLRMGTLRPRPSILWFLGSGTGAPLQVDYRWSDVSRK